MVAVGSVSGVLSGVMRSLSRAAVAWTCLRVGFVVLTVDVAVVVASFERFCVVLSRRLPRTVWSATFNFSLELR